MRSIYCGLLLVVLFCSGHTWAKSLAGVKQICRQCDGGSQAACEEVQRTNLEAGVNVCDPRRDGHASKGEYNEELFEGDMVLVSSGRAAEKKKAYRWPYGILPYEIVTSGYTNTELSTIKAAMDEIERKTCIRFRERTDEKRWIRIEMNGGCSSLVGRGPEMYQPQTVNLHKDCLHNIGTPAHEFLHALGFYHEQSRPDRDDYIWIDFTNTYAENQYKKQTTDTVTTSNTDYDYGSVMHYGPQGFAIDYNKPVITPKQQGVDIGQRKGLSTLDAYEVNAVYNQCRDGDPDESQGNSSTGTGGCADSDRSCADWAEAGGYCDTDAYVKEHCSKSCGRC